jgi:hypothetical protein
MRQVILSSALETWSLSRILLYNYSDSHRAPRCVVISAELTEPDKCQNVAPANRLPVSAWATHKQKRDISSSVQAKPMTLPSPELATSRLCKGYLVASERRRPSSTQPGTSSGSAPTLISNSAACHCRGSSGVPSEKLIARPAAWASRSVRPAATSVMLTRASPSFRGGLAPVVPRRR